jgi:hypothetical protein
MTDLSNRTTTFLDVASVGLNFDPATAQVSQYGIQVFDTDENVLVVTANSHRAESDASLFTHLTSSSYASFCSVKAIKWNSHISLIDQEILEIIVSLVSPIFPILPQPWLR